MAGSTLEAIAGMNLNDTCGYCGVSRISGYSITAAIFEEHWQAFCRMAFSAAGFNGTIFVPMPESFGVTSKMPGIITCHGTDITTQVFD